MAGPATSTASAIARDVIQNHLLQLLALTAMEEPTSFEARPAPGREAEGAGRRPTAQADGSAHRARAVRRRLGRRGEGAWATWRRSGSRTTSKTETYAAIRVDIDNRRWAGVPFYLRTGKRLARRVTEIALGFKRAPHLPFTKTDTEELGYNALVLRIQPDEGVTLRFGAKVPGTQMEIREVNMDFAYGGSFTESSPEAYERLILDVLLGDPPLFPQHEEVELSWEILDPILDYWAGPAEPAGAVRAGVVGSGRSRRDARPGRLQPGGGHDHHTCDRTPRSAKISAALLRARRTAGSPAQGMVLTLIVVCDESEYAEALEASMARRSGASVPDPAGRHRPRAGTASAGRRGAHRRGHPGRGGGDPDARSCRRPPGLGDPAAAAAGLPGGDLVAGQGAEQDQAADELAQLTLRRLTDAARAPRPLAGAEGRAQDYPPGDTDLSWTRLTPWRALLAAALDQYPATDQAGDRRGRAEQPFGRPAGGLAADPAEGCRSRARPATVPGSPPSG